MTDQELDNLMENGLGAIFEKPRRDDYRVAGITPQDAIPLQDFELGDPFPVKNQYQRGSCTNQAYAHHKERIEQKPMSARFGMALTKKLEGNTEYGAITANAFRVGQNSGTCEEPLYPEAPSAMSWEDYLDTARIPSGTYPNADTHKSQSWWYVNPEVVDIRRALIQHGKKNNASVVLSMKWYNEFNRPKNGVLPTRYSSYVGGHAVDCIGFLDSKQLLKCKNSFGPSWGDNGYFYIPYSIVSDLMNGGNTSLDIPEKLPVDSQYGKKRNLFLEQKTAFNPWLYAKIKRLPSNREISAIVYGGYAYEEVFKGTIGDAWLYKTKY